MVATIVLNQSNIVNDGNNNSLVYKFPNTVSFPNHEIAVQNITMYYSWENINASPLSNNTFSYKWTTGGTTLSFPVVIPDGLYEVSDLNYYLQYTFIKNGHYLINAGKNVYYAEFLVNPTKYAVQINTFPVPTSLPSGYTAPTANAASGSLAWQGYPTTTFNPEITIPDNFSKILGFTSPSPFITEINVGGGTNKSYTSNVSPQVQPNSSAYISISNIQNKYSTPSSIIYSITPNVAFGTQIVDSPSQFAFNKLISGTYSEIRLQILGIDFQPLKIRDPNMTIILVIRDTTDLGDRYI